jgi:hypothetical protein
MCFANGPGRYTCEAASQRLGRGTAGLGKIVGLLPWLNVGKRPMCSSTPAVLGFAQPQWVPYSASRQKTNKSKGVEGGHIGMTSTRTKVLAADGQFDVRATSTGTEATVCIPLHPAEFESAAEELAAL